MNLDLPMKEVKEFAPMDEVQPLVDHLQKEEKNLMLVGHLPQLAILASSLITRGEGPIVFNLNTCGLIALECYKNHSSIESENPLWILQWIIDSQLYAR